MSADRSLVRRAAPALALTGASALGLLLVDRGSGAANPPGGNAAGPQPSSAGNQRSNGGAGGSHPGTTVAAAPNARRTPTTARSASGSGSGSGSGACAGTTKTGPQTPISDRRRYFGTVTVTVTVDKSGRICDVSAQYQVRDMRSQRIEDYSIPRLNAQAKAANSAQIHGISGATAVSAAYATSLQAALDAAH